MERTKILVVDDESRMRKLVKDFLQKNNYEVLEAGDGSEALDIFFAQNDIALVILDVMMPKMDGWQVCREIRNYSRVPIIMLTARGDAAGEVLDEGGIHLDKTAHMVTIGDRSIDLSFKEFELLAYFMENKGIALSREKILNNVWNYDYFGDARTIDTHVKKLRSKLGEKGEMIRTIWGMGYKFDPDEKGAEQA